VEIAMMTPVPPYGHRVPMLAGGEAAPEFAKRLKPLGFSIEIAAREIGVASATKMFRSIMAKGMEALITECVLGASRNGAEPRVFASLASFPGIDWPKLADYMIGRVVAHGESCARNGRGRRHSAIARHRAHHGRSHRAKNGLERAARLEAAVRRRSAQELP
jgi:hypothetical protein